MEELKVMEQKLNKRLSERCLNSYRKVYSVLFFLLEAWHVSACFKICYFIFHLNFVTKLTFKSCEKEEISIQGAKALLSQSVEHKVKFDQCLVLFQILNKDCEEQSLMIIRILRFFCSLQYDHRNPMQNEYFTNLVQLMC